MHTLSKGFDITFLNSVSDISGIVPSSSTDTKLASSRRQKIRPAQVSWSSVETNHLIKFARDKNFQEKTVTEKASLKSIFILFVLFFRKTRFLFKILKFNIKERLSKRRATKQMFCFLWAALVATYYLLHPTIYVQYTPLFEQRSV